MSERRDVRLLRELGLGSRYLREGQSPVRNVIEDMRRKGYDERQIQDVEDKAIALGELDLTYEGAERIYARVKAQLTSGEEEILGQFDETRDADLIANYMFCLNPEIRRLVGNAETLYRIKLKLEEGSYKKPLKSERPTPKENEINSEETTSSEDMYFIKPSTAALAASIPRQEFLGKEESQRRLRVLLRKKVERETFPRFNEDDKGALKLLEDLIEGESNENLRYLYKDLRETYAQYSRVSVEEANPNFADSETGKNTLPSLHQRVALYHILKEKRFGVFDDCGTGKTATATLAQSLIENQLRQQGREFRRAVVICPDPTKRDAWEKGLIGGDKERYLREKQSVFTINGQKKDENFLQNLKKAKWIVVNYEQLNTRIKINGGTKDLADVISDLGVDYTIIDECHNIKNQNRTTKARKRSQAECARHIGDNSEYLVLLSGTPIPDKMEDYAVPYQLLHPRTCPLVPDLECNEPIDFKRKIESSPRVLYTFFNQKTVRRTAEEINDHLRHKEIEEYVELDDVQKILYKYLAGRKPTQSWLKELRKAVLDPRLVDPEILRRTGLLGKVSVRNSAKYKRLTEILLSEDGPVAKGEKFVIFSSEFQNGVTRPEHEELRARYAKLGLEAEYEALGFNKPLGEMLEDALKKRYGKEFHIGVIDGKNSRIEDNEGKTERDIVVGGLKNGLTGILCTTDSGGEGIDLTGASWGFFLDRDYSPKTQHQAQARMVRKGQHKTVKIVHFYGKISETNEPGNPKKALDEVVRDYVNRKRRIIQTAVDGYGLTEEEENFLRDKSNKRLKDMITRGLGGQSINVLEAKANSLDDFSTTKRIHVSTQTHVASARKDYEGITEAQELMRLIGQDPVNCWGSPEFAELYMHALPQLGVYPVHFAKIMDLARRAKSGEIAFPTRVLSEGSGPSLLFNAYHMLEDILRQQEFEVPIIFDRDKEKEMLSRGSNPNQILGDMTGKNSTIQEASFDMVDNQSISLLRNPGEVKNCLIEANRVLSSRGLLELVVKDREFVDRTIAEEKQPRDFYEGVRELGFELITERNQGFSVSKSFLRRLKELQGSEYAESYARKLAGTRFLLARKIGKPNIDVPEEHFWFSPTRMPEEYIFEEMQEQESTTQDIEIQTRKIERERREEGIGKRSSRKSAQKIRKAKREVRVLAESIPGLKVSKDKEIRMEF